MPSADARNTLHVQQEVRRGKGHTKLPSDLHGRNGVHFLIIAPTLKSQIRGEKGRRVIRRKPWPAHVVSRPQHLAAADPGETP